MEIDIGTILSIVVLLVGIGFGYIVGDNRYKKFKVLFDDFTHVMNHMNDAMKDDKVTEQEAQDIWDAVLKAYKDLVDKGTPAPATLKK
jgi:hypothetical protein